MSGSLPDESIRELLLSAQENRRGFIKNDPVEKTEEYLAVIDNVEKKIDKAKQMNFCFSSCTSLKTVCFVDPSNWKVIYTVSTSYGYYNGEMSVNNEFADQVKALQELTTDYSGDWLSWYYEK